ncbi:hypothetical protein [Rhizobium sp. GN54]|uniref:hypothetical protein n=1 Tax=Rhizobium sp. GN54 TaxID=2898150 RepID=UPI001E433FE4|nr:hypothetical protein [Rhizobium sp. GN54]MCD2182106.1 hypothetical protein [Rhizobium sp. GN54]
MTRHISCMLLISCAVSLSTCANVTAIPVTERNAGTVQGIRLPERKPLIVVMGSNVSVMWVCNNDRSVALQFGAFLARHHFKTNFDSCGALTSVDSEMDNTEIPLALISFFQKLAEDRLPAGAGASGEVVSSTASGRVPFQVFDVRFSPDDNVSLVPLVHSSDLLLIPVAGSSANSSGGAGAKFSTVPGNKAGGGSSAPPTTD